MGRQIFVIEEKMLLNFFYYAPNIFIFLISSTSAPKVSVEPCLVSVVLLKRGCSGTGEYEAGKETITVYSLQTKLDYSTALHLIF